MRPPPHGARRTVFQALTKPSSKKQMMRAHHPDPFNPKTTKGWANALKVRFICWFESLRNASALYHLVLLCKASSISCSIVHGP